MAPVHLPYLEISRSRHGRQTAYYRRDGVRRRLTTIEGAPVDPTDTPALIAAWQRADAAHKAADTSAAAAKLHHTMRPGSFGQLIALYRASPEWDEKKPETRRDYEKALKPLERDAGNVPVAGVRRHHIGQIRDKYAWRQDPDPDPANPGKTMRVRNARQANRIVTMLSILLTFAADLGWRQDNPALRPKRLKTDGDGYRAWRPDEYLQFIERADPEWRFAALFAVLTGQRGQDQVAIKWGDYDGAGVYVEQQKGNKRVKLWIEAHPELRPALDARKAALAQREPRPLNIDLLPILCRPDGTPWRVNAFQKAAGVAIRAAGLEGIVWHGLRAASLTWAADGGASDKALQALGGHRTQQTLSHYTRGADQKRLAGQATQAIVLPIRPGVAVPKKRKVPPRRGT